ncbi:hypothetical protein ACFYNY_24030 [Streptomyces sp. NPDC006530]|uniref:hypothetical protein n=1 Tax=Streptomyces sp. NPDC006530 TaxID=3364750 RepID=UPI0036BAF0E6
MTIPALHEIETSEGDDGTMHPAEQLWTPCADGMADRVSIATSACTSPEPTTPPTITSIRSRSSSSDTEVTR